MYAVTILESQECGRESRILWFAKVMGKKWVSRWSPAKLASLVCLLIHVYTHTHTSSTCGVCKPPFPQWHGGPFCLTLTSGPWVPVPTHLCGEEPLGCWSSSTWKLSEEHSVILYFRLRSSPTQALPYQGHVSYSGIDHCTKSIWSHGASVESFLEEGSGYPFCHGKQHSSSEQFLLVGLKLYKMT